ncbi:MAG: LemA family protein [Candidatus Peribacteraceae bacterium]|nr:LemA family protein [Candidatus Peribacteraceae bacterium]
MSRTLWIVLAVAVVLLGWLWTSYNNLVGLRGGVDLAWAQVQTDLQRRFDLVPNLQATVQGAADFEQGTLTEVVAARTKWMSAQSAGDQAGQVEAANDFQGALSRLLVTVESYPQLTATQGFRDLQVQLEGTENRIATARRDYNQAVTSYNVGIRTFPTNIAAGMLGFAPAETFQGTPGSESAPSVQFDFRAVDAD